MFEKELVRLIQTFLVVQLMLSVVHFMLLVVQLVLLVVLLTCVSVKIKLTQSSWAGVWTELGTKQEP